MIKKKVDKIELIKLNIWSQTVEFSYISENIKRKWKEKIWVHASNKKETIKLINKFIDSKLNEFKYLELNVKLYKDLKNSKKISNSLFPKVYGQIIYIDDKN
jgi:hypothetical protein